MTTRVYHILQRINYEGLGNEVWGVEDFGEKVNAYYYFNTAEHIYLRPGKYIYVYTDSETAIGFTSLEKPDYKLEEEGPENASILLYRV